MAEKQKPQDQKKEFTFADVDNITQAMQSIYALDDAVANQVMLKRPISFVQPLQNIRNSLNESLKAMMLKGQTQQTEKQDGVEPERQ